MAEISVHELQAGRVIPNFTLPRCDSGEAFELRSLKPRHSVVLIFAHTGDCPPCREVVDRFVEHAEMLRDENAELIVVVRAEKGTRWPQITVLCDPDGRVTEAYLRGAGAESGAGVGLFITDRWQALREWAVADEEAALPDLEHVVKMIRGIEAECPECAPVASGWGEEQ